MAFIRKPGLVYRVHEAGASRTLRFTRSRVRFYQKLKEWYPDDPGMRAFYQRDILVPRFCRSTIGAGEIARRKKDRQAVRAVYAAYKKFSPKPLFYRLFTPLLHPLFPDALYFAVEGVRKFLKDCLNAVFAK